MTNDVKIRMVNNIVKNGYCSCVHLPLKCNYCLVDMCETAYDKCHHHMTTDERLLGMAFIMTMPKDIVRGIKEQYRAELKYV
jgi:hypothetical protein